MENVYHKKKQKNEVNGSSECRNANLVDSWFLGIGYSAKKKINILEYDRQCFEWLIRAH